MSQFASASLSIDLNRIAAICEEEWHSFLDDVGIDPIPERQDLRAFFLNWVAVFVAEAFPSSLISQMATWMEEHQATDETVWGFATKPSAVVAVQKHILSGAADRLLPERCLCRDNASPRSRPLWHLEKYRPTSPFLRVRKAGPTRRKELKWQLMTSD